MEKCKRCEQLERLFEDYRELVGEREGTDFIGNRTLKEALEYFGLEEE